MMLLAWLMLGFGVVLLYSGIKGHNNPWTTITATLQGKK